MPTPLNPDDDLWTRIKVDETENFLRRFRRTACPVMGDDDIDDDPADPDGSDESDSDEPDK